MSQKNYPFPYKFIYMEYIKVDCLLDSLIRRDYDQAHQFIANGMKLEDIDECTFKRALYEFVPDYEMMEFLINNGFDRIHFPYFDFCLDEYSRGWGLTARAYFLGRKDIMELVLRAGFSLLATGNYYWVGSEEEPRFFKRYIILENFDKEIIDLMISCGESPDEIIGFLYERCDGHNEVLNQKAYQYIKSKYTLSSQQKSESEGCYIATAVYGGYDMPEVLVLRKFRDQVLKKNFWGRTFIKLYYALSPSMAEKLKYHDKVNKKVKYLLDKFVKYLKSNAKLK